MSTQHERKTLLIRLYQNQREKILISSEVLDKIMTRIIDLSVNVHWGMQVFPRVIPPLIKEVETHREFAHGLGITLEKYGIDEITNHCIILMGDHVGTHIDSLWHGNPNSNITADKIPLEYCYSDGVVLDMSFKEPGEYITPEDLQEEEERIGYRIKPRDIVLIRTDCATRYWNTPNYLDHHPGLNRDAGLWLWKRGVRVFGVDAPTVEIPVKYMLERGELWPVHRLMREIDLYHLENLINLDKIPRLHGFKVSVLPIKLVGASASPVRAVAIFEE
ncbi:MAG: cyclase family protein [Candidatus Bathyarchaeia archaeon]